MFMLRTKSIDLIATITFAGLQHDFVRFVDEAPGDHLDHARLAWLGRAAPTHATPALANAPRSSKRLTALCSLWLRASHCGASPLRSGRAGAHARTTGNSVTV
jgi:hypothetical protein